MMMMLRATLCTLLVSWAAAFAPVSLERNAGSALHMAVDESRSAFLKKFSLICGGVVVSTMSKSSANAVSSMEGAPSMMVADSVKMLDMSLPSYGDISDSKTSVENTKSLYLDPSTTKGMGIAASQKKKGIPMSSVLPSMGKESADKKKKKPSSSVGDYNF